MINEKTTSNQSFIKVASIYGLIMGLGISAVHLIFYLLENKIGFIPKSFLTAILDFALVVAVIVIATRKYTKMQGFITYWQAFAFGITIFIFAGIIDAAYTYMFSNLIDADYAYRQLDLQINLLKQFQFYTAAELDEQYKAASEMLDVMATKPLQSIYNTMISYMVYGTIFCLVSSILLRKKKIENLTENQI